MVVDAMIRNWVTVVAGEDAEQKVFGRAVQRMEVLFYTNGGTLEYPRPEQLQEALVILTGMLNLVGLKTNVTKMVGMTCQTCCMDGR